MNAKAGAVKKLIEDLPKARRYLRLVEEEGEERRASLRTIAHLPSCREMTENDRQRTARIRAQISETERVLASLPDALERDLVLLRAQGKPWHAIFAETYTSEATGYRRYRKACERLYEPMLDAGLIRKPAPEPPAGKA